MSPRRTRSTDRLEEAFAMFQNKVFGFVVCGLSLALGACAYGADESPATGEQSAELVAEGATLEQAGKLPSHEAKAKNALEKAGDLPSFEQKGLERVGEIPDYAGPVGVDMLVPKTLEKPPVAVTARGADLLPDEMDTFDQHIDMKVPTIIRLSGAPLQPAGNPCKYCAR
jgi:hypothetical protein